MKVKNIAFSGFMAAIMLSVTGAANAAVQIASQAYVDNKSSAAETNAVNTVNETLKEYTKTTELGTVINENITNILEDTTTEGGLGQKLDSLESDVSGLQTTVGDETSGLVKDVADAAAAAAKAQGDVDTLAGVVNDETAGLATKASQADLTALTGRVSTNETNIGALQTKVGTAELSTTAKNIAEAINELKTKTDGMVTEGNFNEMNNKITGLETSVGALETAVGDETSGLVKDVADAAAAAAAAQGDVDALDGVVNNETTGLATKASQADLTALTGRVSTNETNIANKADKADTYTKTETKTAISDYAIPRAGANCTAESGRCVLSVDTNGNFIWVDVTAPLSE